MNKENDKRTSEVPIFHFLIFWAIKNTDKKELEYKMNPSSKKGNKHTLQRFLMQQYKHMNEKESLPVAQKNLDKD